MVKKTLLLKSFLVILLITQIYIHGSENVDIKLLSQFHLEQQKEPLGQIWDIAVDENENIYVPDSSFKNLKIYDHNGKLIKTFGRKGPGPGEFHNPMRIDINNHKICVQDLGQFNYIIYNQSFEEITRFFFLMSAHTFTLDNNRVIANEFYRDEEGNKYRGVILDFKGKVLKKLIPIKRSRSDIWDTVTDSYGFIGLSNNREIFLVKASTVRFYKFNKNGGFIKNFGKNPPYFKLCQRTKDFEEMINYGQTSQGRKAGEKWYSSFSWVSGLCVFEEFLSIAIRTYNKKMKKWECRIQLYDLEGNLLHKGIYLPEVGSYSSYNGFFMDSNKKDRIYILEVSEEETPQFRFFKYNVRK